jgi:type II secretory pathway component PulF
MRTRRSFVPILAALFLVAACASTQVKRARVVSVDVHAVLAAVDDAEMTLCNKQPDNTCKSSVPGWTTEKHVEFSKHLVTALQAGKRLNEGVKAIPITGQTKADMTAISAEIEAVTALVKDVLPANSTVVISLTAAKDAILRLLPLFLEGV